MNVVFLSPHFPAHYFRFCLNLKEAGANVLGIGDEPYDNLAHEVRSALTEYYRVDDLHSYDDLVRACGQQAETTRGELERQRQAVQPTCQLV